MPELQLFEIWGDKGSYTTYSLIVLAPNIETAVELAKLERPDLTIKGDGVIITWPLNQVGVVHEIFTGE